MQELSSGKVDFMSEESQRSVLCLFPEQTVNGLEDFRQRYIFHPGKNVPFHVTLLDNFPQLEDLVISKLKAIAQATPRFEFCARPLSSFPTSKVLYLTPSPVTPIEKLSSLLYSEFPDYRYQSGFPVFHMTVALGYADGEEDNIIDEYLSTFGKEPLALRAHRLGVCRLYGDEWHHCFSVNLGNYLEGD